MHIQKIVHINGKRVGQVGVHATMSTECDVLNHVANVIRASGGVPDDKATVEIYDNDTGSKPRKLQWATLENYLRDCEAT